MQGNKGRTKYTKHIPEYLSTKLKNVFQIIVTMKLWPFLVSIVFRKDGLILVAIFFPPGDCALVMKLLMYHIILNLAMKSLSALI